MELNSVEGTVDMLTQVDQDLREMVGLVGLVHPDSVRSRVLAAEHTVQRALDHASASEPGSAIAELVGRSLELQLQLRRTLARPRVSSVSSIVASLQRVADSPDSTILALRACEELMIAARFDLVLYSAIDRARLEPVARANSKTEGVHRVSGRSLPVDPGSIEDVCSREPFGLSTTQHGAAGAAFAEVLGTHKYVLFPVVVDGAAVALVHCVQQNVSDVDNEDLGLLSLYRSAISAAAASIESRTHIQRHKSRVLRIAEELTTEVGYDSSALFADNSDGCPSVAQSLNVGLDLPVNAHLEAVLTGREKEVLRLAITGATNTMIAETLFISGETVKSHVKSILRKTGAVNRSELITLHRHVGPPPTSGSDNDGRAGAAGTSGR